MPLYFCDASGCRMEDVDGNHYIDYTLGWGPLILGHRHPALLETLRSQVERPHLYGAQHDLEFQVAEKIQSLVPCAERVAFTSSGSEAVQIALRLARAYTGRGLVVKFEGHYHGWMDTALISYHPRAQEMGALERPNRVLGSQGQVPVALEDVLVCVWNRVDLLKRVFEKHKSEIAAVIMEPVLCNSGCLVPKDSYLPAVRELCTRYGAVLIFDEIITGFRMSLGGAQAVYDVKPDLATFGKALAGGLPLSAVAGRREILEQMFDGVVFGGTFNGNPLSLAAASATLGELEKDDGRLLAHAQAMGKELMDGLVELAGKRNVRLKMVGFGTAFGAHFTDRDQLLDYRHTLDDDPVALDQFIRLALEEGVYLLPDGRWYVSAVHEKADVAETLQAIERVLERMS
ncbi:MAG: aspartate aminotransferase family protein [Acidobacteriota bacterium]